jgi:hypothetical protein
VRWMDNAEKAPIRILERLTGAPLA